MRFSLISFFFIVFPVPPAGARPSLWRGSLHEAGGPGWTITEGLWGEKYCHHLDSWTDVILSSLMFFFCFFYLSGDRHDAESPFRLPQTQIWRKVSQTEGRGTNCSTADMSHWSLAEYFWTCVFWTFQDLNHPRYCRPVVSQEICPQQETHNGEIQHPLQPR